MVSFLISTIEHTWPLYLLTFAAGEMFLNLREKKGLKAELVAACVLVFILTALGNYQEHNAFSKENQYWLLTIVNAVSIFMPTAALVMGIQFFIKFTRGTSKHVAIALLSIMTMFLWPMWVLFVTCSSGLDCL